MEMFTNYNMTTKTPDRKAQDFDWKTEQGLETLNRQIQVDSIHFLFLECFCTVDQSDTRPRPNSLRASPGLPCPPHRSCPIREIHPYAEVPELILG